MMIFAQIAVVHTIDDGFIGLFRGGRDQDPLCAAGQMDCGRVTIVELACAFKNDIAALPIQLLWVVGGKDFDRALA